MARHVSSLVQALDAQIAGETGHTRVNRLLQLHERRRLGHREMSEEELTEYWSARGAIGKAIEARDRGMGDDHLGELLRLDDCLDSSRGVTEREQVDIRDFDKALFWTLRSRIADDIDHAEAVRA